MKKTLFTVVFSGLMALGMVGCGSDDDPISDACDKAATCGNVSTIMPGATTAAQCKQEGDALLKTADSSTQSQIKSGIKECLKQSDCNAFATCLNALQGH